MRNGGRSAFMETGINTLKPDLSMSVAIESDQYSAEPSTAESADSKVSLLTSKSNVNKSKYALMRSRATLRKTENHESDFDK